MTIPPLDDTFPMPTLDELSGYVGASLSDELFLEQCRQSAAALVQRYIEDAEVPAPVLITAQFEVGLKLFARRSAPNGAFNDGTGAVVYAPREVMITAKPLLDPFLPVPL